MADAPAVADQDSGWIDVPPAAAPQAAPKDDSGWIDVPSAQAQPKPQPQQQPPGPNVKPGVSDDDLIRSFGYKPEVIKASPLYQQVVKNKGSGFGEYITEPGSTGQKILSTPFLGGAAMGLWNVGSSLQQFGQHTGIDTAMGMSSKEDTPYLDLLDKVRKENYRQNVLGGQPAPLSATVGQIAGEAVPAVAGAVLSGGIGAGPILGGAISGGLQGMMTDVDVDPNDPSSYVNQKTGQIIGGTALGSAFGGAGKLATRIAKIPFAEKALDKVAQAAGRIPIDINGPGMAALDAEAYAQTGSHLPKPIENFLTRIGPKKPPLTFEEARNFYQNTTALSDDEARKISKLMWPYVKTFRQELHNSLQQAANTVGLGDQYNSAIRAYSQGMMAKRFAGWLAQSAAGKTWTGKIGWGAELWNYLNRNKAEGGVILDRYPSREAILSSLR